MLGVGSGKEVQYEKWENNMMMIRNRRHYNKKITEIR